MLQSFFVLSGEHDKLARDEVVAISKSYDKKARAKAVSRLVLISSSKVSWKRVATRATFVKIAGNLIGTLDDDKIEIDDHIIQKPRTFACRVINLSSKKTDTMSLERKVGSMLKERWNAKVSLSEPHLTIYVIITATNRYLGYSEKIDYPKRPTKRLKYPHELGWKLARCMVNLSQLREGDIICDPFCGTGTILLEAESMGISAIGIDFDPEMCGITRRNLEDNGFESKVINSTFHHLKGIRRRVGAIVADLPYGIASRQSTSPNELVQDLLSIIPKKMRLVLVYKKGLKVNMNKAKKYEIYRHKSLTRVIAVR